jgi:hypothetical protein
MLQPLSAFGSRFTITPPEGQVRFTPEERTQLNTIVKQAKQLSGVAAHEIGDVYELRHTGASEKTAHITTGGGPEPHPVDSFITSQLKAHGFNASTESFNVVAKA